MNFPTLRTGSFSRSKAFIFFKKRHYLGQPQITQIFTDYDPHKGIYKGF